jgi:hypothetical protein
MSNEFINEIIIKQRKYGYNIVKKLPEDIQQVVWQYVFKNSILKISRAVKISWDYTKSEKLKKLLAKTDDTGILQIGYTDLSITGSENNTLSCNNCQYYRFPCLNCHYYVYPNIEPSMWKHPLNPTPKLDFRWGSKYALNHLSHM